MPKRRRRIAIALPFLLLSVLVPLAALVGPASSARADEAGTWYAETVSQNEHGFLVTNYWSKGPRLRSETVFRGHRIVTIVSGEHYYIIDALTQHGVDIRRSKDAIAEDSTRGRPFATEYRDVLARGGEKVGEQVLSGALTDVFRVTDERGKSTVWVTRDEPRFPVRAEYYSRQTKQTASTSYVNWLSALPVPDSFFEPGAQIELERVEYDEYLKRSRREPVGPAPVLYAPLLHGSRH